MPRPFLLNYNSHHIKYNRANNKSRERVGTAAARVHANVKRKRREYNMSKTIEEIKSQYHTDLSTYIENGDISKEDANAIYKALFKTSETNRILFSKDLFTELGPFSVVETFDDLGMPSTGYPFDITTPAIEVGNWTIICIHAPSVYRPLLLQSIVIIAKD